MRIKLNFLIIYILNGLHYRTSNHTFCLFFKELWLQIKPLEKYPTNIQYFIILMYVTHKYYLLMISDINVFKDFSYLKLITKIFLSRKK